MRFWRLGSTLQLFVLHVCMRRLPNSHYIGPLPMPLWETLLPTSLCIVGQRRLRTPVTMGHYHCLTTTRPTTTSTALHPTPHLTTSHQPSWNNYTPPSTRQRRHHYSTPTHTHTLRATLNRFEEYQLLSLQHPQLIYKADYDMGRFTEIYSLKNNYIWNYHMPLFLPDLLHYLNNHEQLHDFQHKAITTILCKSIHYYGCTLLTMTNLTAQQRLQLHLPTPGCTTRG